MVREGGGSYVYKDLGSSAGTRINAKLVVEQRLENGDTLRLGRTAILFMGEDLIQVF